MPIEKSPTIEELQQRLATLQRDYDALLKRNLDLAAALVEAAGLDHRLHEWEAIAQGARNAAMEARDKCDALIRAYDDDVAAAQKSRKRKTEKRLPVSKSSQT